MTTSVSLLIPVRTTNPLNGQQGNSVAARMARGAQRKKHRHVAWLCTANALVREHVSPADLVPCVVTLTRVSAGTMDTDGLAASCKGLRDGIADALGMDDGSRFLRWEYAQRKGPQKKFAVEVVIRKEGA